MFGKWPRSKRVRNADGTRVLFVSAHPREHAVTRYRCRHLAEALAAVRPSRVFICGLSVMTTSVKDALLAAGFPEAGIQLEEYDA